MMGKGRDHLLMHVYLVGVLEALLLTKSQCSGVCRILSHDGLILPILFPGQFSVSYNTDRKPTRIDARRSNNLLAEAGPQ